MNTDLKIKSTETVVNGSYLVELKVGEAKQKDSAEKTNAVFSMVVNVISGDIKSNEKQKLYEEIAKKDGFGIATYKDGVVTSIQMSKQMYEVAISGAVQQIFLKSGNDYYALKNEILPIQLSENEKSTLDASIRNKWDLTKQSNTKNKASKKKNDCTLF